MKIAIITDTHFGVRNSNTFLREKQKEFFENTFFPYIDRFKIQHLIHLGDLFDKRKSVDYITLSFVNKYFMDQLNSRNIHCDFVAGNHDCTYKSTNSVNSLKELYNKSSYGTMNFYWEKPVELEFDGLKICLCPWLAPDNEQVCLEFIDKTDATYLMGHFELQGYTMGRGQICDHGLDASLFSKFHSVYSGHFHTQSKGKNVHYLGTPYQMTWNDYGEKKGFHVLDTETLDLEFIQNPHESFIKIKYEDSELTVADIANLDTSNLQDAFVKVILINRTNSYLFDLFIDKLNSSGAAGIKVVDDDKNLDSISDEELLSETESTEVILQKYISSLEVGVDKENLSKFILGLYEEAMSSQ